LGKNKGYEPEIELASIATQEQVEMIPEVLGVSPDRYLQFYFSQEIYQIVSGENGQDVKQKAGIDLKMIPKHIRRFLKGEGIPLTKLDSCRIRYCPEENSWVLTIKLQEEPRMKQLRKKEVSKEARLSSVIRKEFEFRLTASQVEALVAKKAVTGVVLKDRYNIRKKVMRELDPKKNGVQPVSMTLDVLHSPRIIRDGQPMNIVRAEIEFKKIKELIEFLNQYCGLILPAINRVLESTELELTGKKLYGQKLTGYACGEELGRASMNYTLRNLYRSSQRHNGEDLSDSPFMLKLSETFVDEIKCLVKPVQIASNEMTLVI
jgi:hypothetical protein